jgi:hypothetical protein
MPATASRFFALALAIGTTALSMTGCSDDTTGTGTDATVAMKGEMTGSSVTAALRKDDGNFTITSIGEVVDSLKVTRVRILVSEMKLHRSNADTTTGDNTVKTAPMMITIDSAGTRTFTTATVPAGSYDKIKFEFHRFSSSEVGTYLNDTVYTDFVTNDRYTFIMDGRVYKGGVATPFTYRSDATANLTLKFEPAIDLAAGSSSSIVLQVDPAAVFSSGNDVLDPRDEKNESSIDNAIKAAIKALKR